MVTSTGTRRPSLQAKKASIRKRSVLVQNFNGHQGVGEMNTEQHAWGSNRVVAISDWRVSRVCGCGQDLDICAGTHCPRCGTSLHGHAAGHAA